MVSRWSLSQKPLDREIWGGLNDEWRMLSLSWLIGEVIDRGRGGGGLSMCLRRKTRANDAF